MTATVPAPDLDAQARRLARATCRALRAAGLACASAESCTGGLVGHLLTEVAGSSACFLGGAVTYSNAAKCKVLGVDEALLRAHGAVSAEVAAAMARGARVLYDADLAVSVTGVAGPDGGTPAKPVGTTYLHLAAPDAGDRAAHYVWPGDRSGNKLLSAQAALKLLLDHVQT